MARLARKIQNGNIFHIMTKGINREKIFSKKSYKEMILNLYFDEKYDWKIYAYAIMDNHTHFLVYVKGVNDLSEIMKSINVKYSRFYNFVNDRNGHLFQNRYKSVEIKSDKQLFEVLRYIHNNPVFAGIKNELGSYEFTSYKNFFIRNINYPIDKEFVDKVRDNFKNQENFYDFHKERFFSIEMDTKEDITFAQNYIMKYINARNLKREELIEYGKKLVNLGFSKRFVGEKLKISRRNL